MYWGRASLSSKLHQTIKLADDEQCIRKLNVVSLLLNVGVPHLVMNVLGTLATDPISKVQMMTFATHMGAGVAFASPHHVACRPGN